MTAPGLLLAILLIAANAAAGDAPPYNVLVQAAVQASPPRVTLSWVIPSAAGTGYGINRRTWSDAGGFTAVATGLPATTSGWTDTSVIAGTAYEYQIVRSGVATRSTVAYGYVSAAIGLPLNDSRGTVVLLVDQTLSGALAGELTTLQGDLARDGWNVIRHDVPHGTTPDAPNQTLADTQNTAQIKAQIVADHAADPNVNHVLILGHIPVPYAGLLAPDGHGDHYGAWPADAYFGDMGAAWTDATVNNPTPGGTPNVPGDGRFDPTSIPGTGAQLAVGRVDLSNLYAFAPLTETDLMRRYLAKDHAWRTGQWQVQSRGLVWDQFRAWGEEWPAQNGWRMSSVVGTGNMTEIGSSQWFPSMSTGSYLMAYGCGYGGNNVCQGVGTTTDFAQTSSKAVFTMLFGSYFGDWNGHYAGGDDLMKAVLANDGYGLTCVWAGRSNVVVHRLALGATIGDNMRLTQASTASYYATPGGTARSVCMTIIGDPTLRAHPIVPPGAVQGSAAGGNVTLTWTASTTPGIVGYHIYRAASAAGPFVRRSGVVADAGNPTGSPVVGTTWSDSGVAVGTYVYLIKAVKMETTPGGTYVNTSLGSPVSITVTIAATAPVITTQPTNQTVTVGGTATFTVAATGSPAPTYQWRKGVANIAGATGAGYTTPTTVLADSGAVFSVVVGNGAGSVTSGNATLTVNTAVSSANDASTGSGNGCGAGVGLSLFLGMVLVAHPRSRRNDGSQHRKT